MKRFCIDFGERPCIDSQEVNLDSVLNAKLYLDKVLTIKEGLDQVLTEKEPLSVLTKKRNLSGSREVSLYFIALSLHGSFFRRKMCAVMFHYCHHYISVIFNEELYLGVN